MSFPTPNTTKPKGENGKLSYLYKRPDVIVHLPAPSSEQNQAKGVRPVVGEVKKKATEAITYQTTLVQKTEKAAKRRIANPARVRHMLPERSFPIRAFSVPQTIEAIQQPQKETATVTQTREETPTSQPKQPKQPTRPTTELTKAYAQQIFTSYVRQFVPTKNIPSFAMVSDPAPSKQQDPKKETTSTQRRRADIVAEFLQAAQVAILLQEVVGKDAQPDEIARQSAKYLEEKFKKTGLTELVSDEVHQALKKKRLTASIQKAPQTTTVSTTSATGTEIPPAAMPHASTKQQVEIDRARQTSQQQARRTIDEMKKPMPTRKNHQAQFTPGQAAKLHDTKLVIDEAANLKRRERILFVAKTKLAESSAAQEKADKPKVQVRQIGQEVTFEPQPAPLVSGIVKDETGIPVVIDHTLPRIKDDLQKDTSAIESVDEMDEKAKALLDAFPAVASNGEGKVATQTQIAQVLFEHTKPQLDLGSKRTDTV